MDMDTYCQRFRFVTDMNGDLAFTMSDVWLLIQAAFLLPSTAVASVLHRVDTLSTFFEVDCSTGRGIGGALLSLFVWIVVCTAVLSATD
jgi:hypothetical protein